MVFITIELIISLGAPAHACTSRRRAGDTGIHALLVGKDDDLASELPRRAGAPLDAGKPYAGLLSSVCIGHRDGTPHRERARTEDNDRVVMHMNAKGHERGMRGAAIILEMLMLWVAAR